MEEVYCSNCGERLEDEMLFCPNCGTKVEREDGAEGASAPRILSAGELRQDEPKKEAEPQKEEQKAPEKEAEPPKEEQKAPEKEVEPQKVEQKAPKKTAAVIIMCILLFVTGLLADVSGVLRLSYAGGRMAKLVDRLDLEETTFPSMSSKQELSLVDFLEEASGFEFEKEAGISKKDLTELLNKSYVKEMVSDILTGYTDFFFTGKEPDAFGRDDVVKFVKKHDDDFYELLKFRFTYMDPIKQERVVYTADIDGAFQDLGTDEITLDWVEKETGIPMHVISLFLSVTMLAIYIGLSVLLLILLPVIVRKRADGGLTAEGVTVLLLGVLSVGAAVAGMIYLGGRKSSIVALFLAPLCKNLLLVGCGILVLGILFIVCGRVRYKKRIKRIKEDGQLPTAAEK